MGKTVTITLSEDTAEQLQELARLSQRTLEDVASEMLNSTFVSEENLEAQLEAVSGYSDNRLWALVDRDVTPVQRERLNQLRDRVKSSQALNESEEREYRTLLNLVEIYMLWRSAAVAELKQRGYKVGRYVNQPDS